MWLYQKSRQRSRMMEPPETIVDRTFVYEVCLNLNEDVFLGVVGEPGNYGIVNVVPDKLCMTKKILIRLDNVLISRVAAD